MKNLFQQNNTLSISIRFCLILTYCILSINLYSDSPSITMLDVSTPPAVEISKGEFADGIQLTFTGDFNKISNFTILRRKLKNDNNPWEKISSSFSSVLFDKEVKPRVKYIYKVTFENKRGNLQVLKGVGFSGNYESSNRPQIFPYIEVSKGTNRNNISISLSVEEVGDLESVSDFRLERVKENNNKWEVISTTFASTFIDVNVEVYAKYHYRLSFKDKYGTLHTLYGVGHRGNKDRPAEAQTYPYLKISKGKYHDGILLQLSSPYDGDFDDISHFQIEREKIDTGEKMIMSDSFKTTIIDVSVEAGKKHLYIYRISYIDKYGNKIVREDCGYRAKSDFEGDIPSIEDIIIKT